jgi:hypothetical protein
MRDTDAEIYWTEKGSKFPGLDVEVRLTRSAGLVGQ